GSVQDYQRELWLLDGIARTTYTRDGVRFTQEAFASAVDDALIVRLEASEAGALDTRIALTRVRDAATQAISDNELLLSGQLTYPAEESRGPAGPGMRFAARLRAFTEGGAVTAADT